MQPGAEMLIVMNVTGQLVVKKKRLLLHEMISMTKRGFYIHVCFHTKNAKIIVGLS